jgi:ribonuclease D
MSLRRRRRSLHHAEAHAPGGSVRRQQLQDPLVPQGEPEMLSTPADVAQFLDHIRAAGSFAYDTEFIGEETFLPHICLVQLATTERIGLVDPTTLSEGAMRCVWKAVCDPTLQTIVHAGGQDVLIAQRGADDSAASVIDTQIAAGLTGMPWPLSLGNLVESISGIRLPKGHTFTEWDRRPLSRAQIGYAADDVRFLPLVWAKQRERLDALGRTAWVTEETREATRQNADFDPQSQVRRASRGLTLRPRELTVLRELVIIRQEIAQALNLPPRTALPDGCLLELARMGTADADRIARVRGIPRTTLQHFARNIEDTLTRAHALPAEQDAQWDPRPESAEQRTQLDALWSIVSMRSIALGIAATLVTSRAELAGWFLSDREERPHLFPDGSWRQEAIGSWLESFLRGERHLNLRWQNGGPTADAP